MMRFALILFCASAATGASLLEQRIDESIRNSQAVEAGSVGIEVVQLATGKLLYSRQQDKLLTPASNTKLFTTALALTRLGPAFQIGTRILESRGDLVIRGGGDPSMSFIQIPYDQDAKAASPMEAVDQLADRLIAGGLRSISGNIVGDDTAFPWEPFAPGWGVADPLWEYGAPVSALCLGSNSVRLSVMPGAGEGDPATLEFDPPLEYFNVDNRVRTVAAGEHRLEVHRLGGRELQLSGAVSIAAGPSELWLAVDDPALYTATALYDALTRRGVAVAGHPTARHRYDGAPASPSGALLVERSSPPLSELLRVTDKVSQNLWAELMLRQVALARTGDGSRRAGLIELKAFLKEIGLEDGDYVFDDGSGLSRSTLVKPAAVVRLLQFMYNSPVRDLWISLMPVGGQDGTLAKRFGKDPAARNIHAKTGSLTHVNALSGYAESATYGEVAFSILVNHTGSPAGDVRDFIDKIGMLLLE